jgi:PTH2 family peptidyl-tRNA hydrolase
LSSLPRKAFKREILINSYGKKTAMKELIVSVVKKIKKMTATGYKQVILMREDLNLPKGKMAAQAAHASVEAVFFSDKEIVASWRKEGMKKIVLKVKDEKELLRYLQYAKDSNLVTAMITDAGHTVVEPGTKTCVSIGPDLETKIDRVTENLPLY